MITNRSIGRYGRFANGMFQIAAVIGIARKSGQPFGFEPWFNYDHKDRFGSTEDIDLQKYFINPLPPINPDLNYTNRYINWGYEDLYLPLGNWDLQGHFQSEKWFENSIDEVRWYFQMHGQKNYENFTALHWRAGDYENGENVYHPRQKAEYYKSAMNLIGADPDFTLIFSDNIEEAKQMFRNVPERNFQRGNYIDDFRKMKMCRNFICANSSYSLMAAILGEHPQKQIVCPSLWFGTAANGLPTKDLYPEGAIII